MYWKLIFDEGKYILLGVEKNGPFEEVQKILRWDGNKISLTEKNWGLGLGTQGGMEDIMYRGITLDDVV